MNAKYRIWEMDANGNAHQIGITKTFGNARRVVRENQPTRYIFVIEWIDGIPRYIAGWIDGVVQSSDIRYRMNNQMGV